MKCIIPHNGSIKIIEKPIPKIVESSDAIVKVTKTAICTSDLHIIEGFVPRYIENTVLGHEFVGEVIEIGSGVSKLKVGDRVVANCITFCGECYFCKNGFINNCINGGWELGCRIDGGQAEYVRVPYADCGLNKIPDNITDEEALFVGDILSSGYFGVEGLQSGETIAVIGSGPVGLCAMMSAKLLGAGQIIAIDINDERLEVANQFADYTINPNFEDVEESVKKLTKYGVDRVIECAGSEETFEMAWKIARPNAVVFLVAMYEKSQVLPLPEMYGKNLTFKTGGVDAIHCDKLLQAISERRLSTNILISKTFAFDEIEKAYEEFKNKNALKIVISL